MKKFKFIGIIMSFLMLSVACAYAVQTKDTAKPEKDGICAQAPSFIVVCFDEAYELSSLPLVSHDYLRPADYSFSQYWRYHEAATALFKSREGHYRYLDGKFPAMPLKLC